MHRFFRGHMDLQRVPLFASHLPLRSQAARILSRLFQRHLPQ